MNFTDYTSKVQIRVTWKLCEFEFVAVIRIWTSNFEAYGSSTLGWKLQHWLKLPVFKLKSKILLEKPSICPNRLQKIPKFSQKSSFFPKFSTISFQPRPKTNWKIIKITQRKYSIRLYLIKKKFHQKSKERKKFLPKPKCLVTQIRKAFPTKT